MANNNLATIPEVWSREGLSVLTETSRMLPLVNKQYSNELRSRGDTVNAYRADRRTIRRKTDADDYTAADATATAVPVVLNQLFTDSVAFGDREASLSITDLTRLHMVPVMQGIARAVDRAICGFAVHKLLSFGTPANRAGKLGGMTVSNSDDYFLEAQEVLNNKLCPESPRNLVVHQTAETFLKGNELFAAADKRGSAQVLNTGQVGNIYGSDVFMSQNVPYLRAGTSDTQSATVNNAGGYAAGTTSALTVTDPGTNYSVGEYVVLAENAQPTYLTATTGTTSITLNEALKYAVTDASAITHYLKAANEATQRDAGYDGPMEFTHTSGKNLQVGQLISFGTGGSRHTYVIIERSATTATTSTVLLDRPLDATVASSAEAYPGPAGGYNPFLHPDAIAFVSRPLALVGEGMGAISSVQVFDGIGLRVTMGYGIVTGKLQVNFDLLCGLKELNTDMGCVLLS